MSAEPAHIAVVTMQMAVYGWTHYRM